MKDLQDLNDLTIHDVHQAVEPVVGVWARRAPEVPCGKLTSISQADVNEHLKVTSTSTLQSQFVWLCRAS